MIIPILFFKSKLSVSLIPKDLSSNGNVSERNYNKIFVIGFNKTGTTTLKYALRSFGLIIGNQTVGEMLLEDWREQKMDRIFKFCETADAFQDLPFSSPGLYKHLDKHFPGSKFILTVRDSPKQWFQSLVNFHTKKYSSNPKRPPDEKDLANARYLYKGWLLKTKKVLWNYPDVPLYDKEYYKRRYQEHIEDVREYFYDRPDDFIEINVSTKKDFNRLCHFLNVQTDMAGFPLKNKT